MNEPISNNPDERGLLPYPVILAATKGDPEAMKIVVQHYASYIATCLPVKCVMNTAMFITA